MSLSWSSTGLVAAVIAAVVGCAEPPDHLDVLTYDEYKARAYREPDTGFWIVNGDEPVYTEEQLRATYEGYLATIAQLRHPGYGTTEQPLLLNAVNNSPDRWSAPAAANLRYCVSLTGFGLDYATVVLAMTAAAAAWEATANVNFIHDVVQDVTCNASNSNVTFDVSRVCGSPFYARAFFPSTARAGRNVLIDCQALRNIAPLTLAGVLRHELGHALGFRHEHILPEAGQTDPGCIESGSVYMLTTYDRASVMHYPHCKGTNTGDLVLTDRDRQGARIVYP